MIDPVMQSFLFHDETKPARVLIGYNLHIK